MDPELEAENSSVRTQAIAYFNGRLKPFTQNEVSDLLQVTRFTLLRYRRDGKLRAFVCGGVVRFHVEDVFVFLMKQTA